VHSNVAPPSLLRPELSARWDEFCALALQPDPEKRYASARQASVALAAILEEEGLPQPGEISDFVREVEAIPAPSTTSQSVSTLQDPLEAPTVVEQR